MSNCHSCFGHGDLGIGNSATASHECVGGTITHSRLVSYQNNSSAGSFNINGQFTGLGLADFMVGKVNTFSQGAPNTAHAHRWYLGLYAQDSWRAKPRLTLTYGLRWEPDFPELIPDSKIYNFDYGRFQQGIKSTVFKGAPAGFYYPGDPGFPGKSGVYKNWLNFSPRVGFAWDLGGGRTSLRASYGLNYENQPLQRLAFYPTTVPFGSTVTVTDPAGGLDNPWLDFAGGNPFPLPESRDAAIFPPFGNYLTRPYDFQQRRFRHGI